MKLSIIIPVYNTFKYLGWCLDSVLNQDLELNKDYEIICVNDGSTDDSLEKLRRYEAKGIKVINKTNGGVSSARNVGLQNAMGEYVWFVDSDDMVMPNIISSIYKKASIESSDVLSFKHIKCNESISAPPISPYTLQTTENQTSVQLLPSRCIIRKEFIKQNNIKFNEDMTLAEDTLFIYWLIFFNAKITDTNMTAYVYRFNPNSATNSFNKIKHYNNMLVMVQAYYSQYKIYKHRQDLDVQELIKRVRFASQHLLFDSLFCKNKAEQKRLLKWLKSQDLYPYPIFWETINTKYGIKNMMYNLFCLFLPIRVYYYTMAYIIRLRQLIFKSTTVS